MNRKEFSSFERCHTSGSGHQKSHDSRTTAFSKAESDVAPHLTSDKCAGLNDSRLSDSGIWSGSNLQSEEITTPESEEITTPESPVSKSGDFSNNSEKIADSSVMRLDSGIDLSVSQQLSELSLKEVEKYNDLNDPPSKSKAPTSSTAHIKEKIKTSKKPPEPSLLDICFHQNEDGDTELHLAIIHKFIETVYALVRMVPHPKYLNIKNDDRQTPLHLAVLTRQPRLVRLLVCAGASLDVLDRYGNTALHLAVQVNDLTCVRAIIDPITIPETLNAQLQYSPFQFQTHRDIANIVNYEGHSCVHLAALNSNIDILRYLVWFGADINAREWKGGHTCLHMAVERKDYALCMYLLRDTKIDADEMSYAGYTAYQIVCSHWDSSIAKALKDHGVDTYIGSDSDSDDDMLDVSESSFANGYRVNGGGLVNVGA